MSAFLRLVKEGKKSSSSSSNLAGDTSPTPSVLIPPSTPSNTNNNNNSNNNIGAPGSPSSPSIFVPAEVTFSSSAPPSSSSSLRSAAFGSPDSIRGRLLDSPGGLKEKASNIENEAAKGVLERESEFSKEVKEDIHKVSEAVRNAIAVDIEQTISKFREKYGGRDRVEFVRNEEAFVSPSLIRLILSRLPASKGKMLCLLFGVLWILSRNAKNKIFIASHHGIEAAVAVLKKNLANVDVQLAGIAVLLNVASHDEGCAQLVAGEGAAQLVISAMHKHVDNAKLQEQACAALASFSVAAENRPILVKYGAVKVVIMAMKRHMGGGGGGVQQRGASTLTNISASEGLGDELVWEGAVEAILTTIDSFKSVDIQHRCTLVLHNLLMTTSGVSDLATTRILWGGGVDKIVRLLSSPSSPPHLLYSAVQILGMMARKGGGSILVLIWGGVVEAILSVGWANLTHVDFVLTVCETLRLIAANVAGKMRIIEAGGKDFTLTCAKQHVTHVMAAKLAHQLHSQLLSTNNDGISSSSSSSSTMEMR